MKPLSVYVHIPFCVSKCGYCDFLSFSGMDKYFNKYMDKLIEEIRIKSKDLGQYEVNTVFIGGGTPTVLKPEQIAEVVNTIKIGNNFASNLEITVEANPKTVSLESLTILRDCGVNRLSFGLQSENNRLLKFLNRIHDRETFEANFSQARKAGFNNINVDVIFAIPGQQLDDWENTISFLTGIGPEHISAYGLILEEGTPLNEAVGKGECSLPEDEAYLEMYYLAKEKLKKAGYEHYEISNFARPGFKCKHNITYWRCMEYVGFGLGASSYINTFRFRNENDLRKYLKNGNDCLRAYEKTAITKKEAMSEFMFMGLRMMEGVSKKEFEQRFFLSLDDVYGGVLAGLYEKNLIKIDGNRAFLTEKGIDVSNYVFAQFID